MNNTLMTSVGMALLAAAMWGTTGTAQSFASAQASPYWVGALRLVIASLFFATFIGVAGRGRLRAALTLPPAMWGRIALAGLCVASYNLSFFAGIKATGVAVGTAMAIGSGPVWAGLLQSLLLRQPPPPVWWLGTLLAVGGSCLMVLPGSGENLHGDLVDLVGIALCLIAGLSYASYTLLNQRLVRQAPPATVTLWIFSAAAVIATAAALTMVDSLCAPLRDWAIVGYLGLVSTGIAYLLFSHALQHLSGASGVTLALAEPVTAFALAVLIVGERPPAAAFAGLGFVFSGLLLVVWTELRSRRR